jgi:hypothetical protein
MIFIRTIYDLLTDNMILSPCSQKEYVNVQVKDDHIYMRKK